MKLGAPDPTLLSEADVRLRFVTRAIVIALVGVAAFSIGASMELTMLVATLGLFNVGVAVFLLLRRDITWGFIFYLTTVIFFQTGFWIRLPAFPDLYPARVVSILLFLIFGIQVLIGMRKVPPIGPIEKSMLAFMVVMVISMVATGQRPRWQLLLSGYIYPFLFFYFARAAVNRRDQIRLVLFYLVLVGLYFAIMGIFEKFKLYGLVWPKFIVDPTLRDHGLARLGYRVRGIFLQPAILGCVMTMGFFPAWHFLTRHRNIPSMIVRIILLVTTPATIFFTQTRSVYLGFALTLLVAAVWSRKLRAMSIGLVLGGALAVFLNWGNVSSEDRDKGGLGDTNTVNYRIELLYETAEIFMEHPFLGVGFMNFEEAAMRYRKPRDVPFWGHIDLGYNTHAVSHNILVTILAEQGMLGFIPYFLIYFLIIRRSIQAFHVFPKEGLVSREYVVCVWCAITAYVVNAMFLELRYFEYVNVLFFFLVGAMIGMLDQHEARTRAPAPTVAAGPELEATWATIPGGAR